MLPKTAAFFDFFQSSHHRSNHTQNKNHHLFSLLTASSGLTVRRWRFLWVVFGEKKTYKNLHSFVAWISTFTSQWGHCNLPSFQISHHKSHSFLQIKDVNLIFIWNNSSIFGASFTRHDICHKHHKQHLCKTISTRVKFYFVNGFLEHGCVYDLAFW